MSEFSLIAKSPLDGLKLEFDGGLSLAEVTGWSLVSIATGNDKRELLAKAISTEFDTDIPQPGQSTRSTDGKAVFFGLQKDQLFLFFEYDGYDAVETVTQKLGDVAFFTDQSDSWVMLRIAGTQSRMALSRICPVDIHPDVFTKGAVARTMMEHMGTIIYRDGDDSYILFSARSSAKSLLHAVETSVKNIL